jgi:microcystin-dependent protein
LRVTIPSQTLNDVVIVEAFESGAGLTTNLASVSAGQGAALVGVQDAAALYAATNVEAALAEVRVALNAYIASVGTIADLIKRTGAIAFTANQSMGGFKLTNLANGSVSTDAVNLSQITQITTDIATLTTNGIVRSGAVTFTGNQSLGGFKLTSVGTPTAGTDAANKTYVDNTVTPTGFIGMWGTGTAPTGWLLCDGSAVSRTTYAALFALYGTTYGVGDATTTFNLPLNVGTGAPNNTTPAGGVSLTARALGQWYGEEKHVQTIAELAAHTHMVNGFVGGGGSTFSDGSGNYWYQDPLTTSTGNSTPFNVADPKLVINFIVKT